LPPQVHLVRAFHHSKDSVKEAFPERSQLHLVGNRGFGFDKTVLLQAKGKLCVSHAHMLKLRLQLAARPFFPRLKVYWH